MEKITLLGFYRTNYILRQLITKVLINPIKFQNQHQQSFLS